MKELNRADIEAILPHRGPFLFLESATIIEPGKFARGKMTDLIHPDFAFLLGHFPGLPIFPGVLVTETLAQLVGVTSASSGIQELEGKIGVLGTYTMRHGQKILPVYSTLVELEAEIIKLKSKAGKANVRAIYDGKIAAEGEILFAMASKSDWPQF